MASRLRVAVVSITHFSKGAGQSAVNSFIGSIGFIAAARAAFIVARDPDSDDPARRLFVQAKNNLAADSDGLAFRVEQRLVGSDIVASAIAWGTDRITRTADEILAAGREANEKPERSEAEEFLRDTLAAGPRLATEIKSQATAACLAWRTINRAKRDLGITTTAKAEPSQEVGKPPRVQWWWSLPAGQESPRMPPNSQECHVKDVASLGNVGILGGAEGCDVPH
jgi:putative DNA primase/helicase